MPTYKLLCKKPHVKTIELICEFEYPYDIIDLCEHDGDVLILSNEELTSFSEGTMLSTDNSLHKPKYGDLNTSTLCNPSSICSYSSAIYICQDYGRHVCVIHYGAEYTFPLYAIDEQEKINNIFGANLLSTKTSIACNDYGVVWGVDSVSRIFHFSNGENTVVAGDGSKGFSSSRYPSNCSIGGPFGIALDKSEIYATEQGNKCIRKIYNNKISLFLGHPNKGIFQSPLKTVFSRGLLYIIDGCEIKAISLKNPPIQTDRNISIYKNEGDIVSIAESKNGLLILQHG